MDEPQGEGLNKRRIVHILTIFYVKSIYPVLTRFIMSCRL